MGTNYYLKIYHGDICSKCGRSDELEEIHIGKSSSGWKFVIDTNHGAFNSFQEMRNILEKNPNKIFDEYGQNISLFELYSKIYNKRNGISGDNEKIDGPVRISNYSDFF